MMTFSFGRYKIVCSSRNYFRCIRLEYFPDIPEDVWRLIKVDFG